MSSNLKQLCKMAGIKQDVLAKQVGVSQGIVSGWSNGRYYPSAENLIEMTKILRVTAGCILGLEPIPEGYPDDYIRPVIYNEEIENQTKAAEESKPFRQKKPPFNKEQIEYLDQWGDRLTEKIVDSLREDTSLLRETGPEAN